MAGECFRPGCSAETTGTGVCLSCARSEYDPRVDGVEIKRDNGTRITTDGWQRKHGRRGGA